MSGDQNKAIVRRFIEELWNQRNLDLAGELFAAGCVTHQLRSGMELVPAPRGPDAMKEHVAEWLAGFPDLRFTIEQMVAEGDQVVTRTVMQGTHRGVWLGIPPTKKQVSLRMITIHRIAGGKIVEDWVLLESLGFFQQLGLLPATKEIVARAAT
ncbi:MAG TPA: ester cyclase [Anaerolineales bacterium]|nr:ester cyclase [Anaerolineales bacterium]